MLGTDGICKYLPVSVSSYVEVCLCLLCSVCINTIETFLTTVTSLVKTCRYCGNCLKSLIRDRIVLGIKEQTLLREHNLTLEKTIDICTAAENATLQGKMFRAETVNRVVAPKTKESAKPVNMRQIRCKYCGRQHPKQRQQCPAFGQSYRQCGKMNHSAKQCKNKKTTGTFVRNVSHFEDNSDSKSSEVFVNVVSQKPSQDIKCEMIVAARRVTFLVDTDTSANLLPLQTCQHSIVVNLGAGL